MWFVYSLFCFVVMPFDCQLLRSAFIKQQYAFARHRCASDVGNKKNVYMHNAKDLFFAPYVFIALKIMSSNFLSKIDCIQYIQLDSFYQFTRDTSSSVCNIRLITIN